MEKFDQFITIQYVLLGDKDWLKKSIFGKYSSQCANFGNIRKDVVLPSAGMVLPYFHIVSSIRK